jgi:hypothetical protein
MYCVENKTSYLFQSFISIDSHEKETIETLLLILLLWRQDVRPK